MKFTALDFRNYGPFQHAPVLDLGGGSRGLHLIVGPNEAGKSTALRAIRALLFDFPHTTPDNHGRDLATLRIGATLRSETGEELTFLRRKQGKRLWTADDRTALPADALTPLLGGLDEATFVDLFSTDHAELVRGGQLIIRGGGRLGEMLFAAGSGLAQLDQVREALQQEIDKLFKARNAKNPAINKSLDDLKAARELVKKDALPTNDWVDANNQLHRATLARAEVSRRQREAQAELDRWRSWLGALRIIPRRQEVVDRLGARGTTTVLRPGFAETYQFDSEAARSAARTSAEARDALALAGAELAKLGPPDPALLEADAIGRLHADLGRYSGARRDRATLADKLAWSDERVKAIRAEIPAMATIPAAGLTALRDPIQTLAQDHAALLARRGEAEAELARLGSLEPDMAGAEAMMAPDTLRWVASLEEAITRATALGNLEALRLQARGKLDGAEAEAATSLRGLSLWLGTLDALEALAVPPEATFDRFDAEIRAAEDRVWAAEAERTRLEAERIDLDRDAALARVAGAIPTEADLDTHRDRRDTLWRSIRRGWVDREPLAPSPVRLADDFEAATHQADAVADALRLAADRVAADAQRTIDRRNLLDQIALTTQTRDRAAADRRQALEAWAGHWRPLGIEPTSPREMKDWVRVDRKERLRCAKNVRDARAELARITAQVDELRAEIGHALARVGEPSLADGESLAALLARGRAVVARIGARVQRAAARDRLAEVHAAEAAWLDCWSLAVAPLGLPGDASINTARAVVDRLGEWADATREAKATRAALDDLNAIERRFAAEAEALARRLDPEFNESVPDWQPVAGSLVDRLALAGEARTRRTGWLARLDEEQTRLARVQSALARANESLAALAVEAGCPSLDDLPDAIRRSGEVEADQADLRRFDEQLESFAGTSTRAALLEAVAGLDEATLSGRITDVTETLTDLEGESHQSGEAIGAAKERLDAMNTGPGAADAEQAVHDRAARLGVEVERYARLKLASAVLRDAVERHRAKHQGPVLDRAGALFARLTAGSFAGLQTDIDDKGEPILRGVRGVASPCFDDPAPPGPRVDVAAMSEGTADQLYLALRLASLAVHLDDPAHEPAPLVADDILINFDDARARAALEALADLSHRTQVLFFTHHDHLAELARTHLPAALVFIHRLIPLGAEPTPLDPTAPATPKAKRKRSSSVSLADL